MEVLVLRLKFFDIEMVRLCGLVIEFYFILKIFCNFIFILNVIKLFLVKIWEKDKSKIFFLVFNYIFFILGRYSLSRNGKLSLI